MGVLDNDKYLNKIIDEQYQNFNSFYTPPSNETLWGELASKYVEIKQTNESLEFRTISRDFIIKRHIDSLNGLCVLSTYELIMDDQDYLKTKPIHLPAMDIKIQIPMSTQECFRFIKDNIVIKTYGHKEDGSPFEVPQNMAYISNFPAQYLNQLYVVLKDISIQK